MKYLVRDIDRENSQFEESEWDRENKWEVSARRHTCQYEQADSKWEMPKSRRQTLFFKVLGFVRYVFVWRMEIESISVGQSDLTNISPTLQLLKNVDHINKIWSKLFCQRF